MYLTDYHMHSTCSPDGSRTMEQMAAAAVKAGLQEICFTDHLDTVEWGTYAPRTDFPWAEALRQVRKAREKWGDRLTIRLGAELGEAALAFDRAEKLLSDAPELDFVIGSVHMTGPRYGREDLYYLPRADEAYYNDVIADYLDDVLALARWGKCSVLGHLTLPVRYIWDNARLAMDFSAHTDAVAEIFREIIPKGLGIECNTNRGAVPLPDESILRLYREMGGEIITIGSDAHSTGYVGCRVRETQELLRQCGFRYITTFAKGQPTFRPLP
ncbi:MAG: histidinol-phosphatase HisJ family protein [Oscillospiraceae bacterium]|nr:histidinol-phosphatase HisJ family protein [Oscillospiraceae bacterium]